MICRYASKEGIECAIAKQQLRAYCAIIHIGYILRPESTLNEPFLAQEMVTVTIFDEAGKPIKHGYIFFLF